MIAKHQVQMAQHSDVNRRRSSICAVGSTCRWPAMTTRPKSMSNRRMPKASPSPSFRPPLPAAKLARAYGMMNVMGAPNVVRGGSHSGNISALALAEAGLLDVLSSDYVPASLLHAAFLLHQRAGHRACRTPMRTVALNPARAIGLHRPRRDRAAASAPTWCACACMATCRSCARCGATARASPE